jgi:hypothetical protein
MKQLFLIAILTASLAACGGKKAQSTTPGNTGGSAMEQKTDGATGGASYGGAPAEGATPDPCGGAAADPCAGGE